MADTFVSYAHEDELRVRPIVEELRQLGWSVFWDSDIPPGCDWDIEIAKMLNESSCVVVVWTHASVNLEEHHWVREEAAVGRKRKILVPVRLDVVDAPFGFGSIQMADLSEWKNDHAHPKFRQCVEVIRSKIAQPAGRSDRQSVSPPPPVIQPKAPSNFVHIRGGEFTMGSPESEVDRGDDESQHQVKVSDFYLCRYTVMVEDFKQFIVESGYKTGAEKGDGSFILDGTNWKKKTGVNWRHGVSGNERETGEYNHPVLHVSWNDA
jgi:formylglycine-generating enzyme